MDDESLSLWFANNKTILETAYLSGIHPWQQSGVGLRTPSTYAAVSCRWCRRRIIVTRAHQDAERVANNPQAAAW